MSQPSSTYDGLKKGISIELDIDEAQISIKKLSDLADPSSPDNILNTDGSAIGTKLEDYAEKVYNIQPIFWGNLIADESVWDVLDASYSGTSYLPHLWDASASGFLNIDWQAGIGDLDDLIAATPSGIDDNWYPLVHTGFFYILPPSGKGIGQSPLGEFYLYSNKMTDIAPSGANSFTVASGTYQGAPIVVTSSGYQTVSPKDPWAQIDGSGRYRKRAVFELDSSGVIDTSVDEFKLDPDASGKIIFNKALVEPVFIEYEASTNPYYVVDLPINPWFTGQHSGFLYLAQAVNTEDLQFYPCQLNLSAYTYQTLLKSTVANNSTILTTAYDKSYNPVKDIYINFEVYDFTLGYLVVYDDVGNILDSASGVKSLTDSAGQASATYIPNDGQEGTQVIKSYYEDCPSNYDEVRIMQRELVIGPFTADISKLDSLDYLI